MNNLRRINGKVDPDEPQPHIDYITSAGSKNTFAYEQLIELVIKENIDPQDVFVWGSGWKLPVYYGLANDNFLRDQRISNTFDASSFARENESIWTSGAKDSWFNQTKLLRARSLMRCEREANLSRTPNAFYIIGCDVARSGNNDTSIMVIKVLPRQNAWEKQVVYTENLTNMPIPQQNVRLRQLDALFHPREIVVDGNTLGMGLLDLLVLPCIDDNGVKYDPIYVMNNPENYPIPPANQRDGSARIYDMQANAQLNSDIYSNLYLQINSGSVKLLANERAVKEKILLTKKGQKMSYYQREKFLLPYVMTSRLIDEINNLRLKALNSANTITVEQISKRINKDRVSALGYGLYRVKFYEDQAVRKNKGSIRGAAATLFTSKRNRRQGE